MTTHATHSGDTHQAAGKLRAAVLCPGPSLVRTFEGKTGRYGLVIGVNRAVGRFSCDYWSMLDDHSFAMAQPIGHPTVLCDPTAWQRVKREFPHAAQHDLVTVRDVSSVPLLPTKWHTWSATAAVALAHHLGARHIDCFGMDWSGIEDFDGTTDARNVRDADRWRRERDCYHGLVDLLAELGTTVARVMPEKTPVSGAGTNAMTAEVPAS